MRATRTEAPQHEPPAARLLYTVHFTPGSARLTAQDKRRLKAYRPALAGKRLRIRGFTDSAGSRALNDRLARRRAQAVKTYLISLGLSPGDIRVSGQGHCCYAQGNDRHPGRAANRRAQITVEIPTGASTLDPPTGGTR